MRRWIAVLVCVWCGCGTGDVSMDGGEDSAALSVHGACDTLPFANWDSFGAGFVAGHCNGCHAETSVNRYGAPPDVTFDTEAQALAWSDRILARSTGSEADMPPRGGVTEDEAALLVSWLACRD